MHCGACIRRVTQSLGAVPGAEVEEVRLGAARVQVPDIGNAQTSQAEISDALIAGLAKAGFAAQIES